MKLLLDTHVLVWMTSQSNRLSPDVRKLLAEPANTPVFSVVSLWEIALKFALRPRANFHVDARQVREKLLDNDFDELPIAGEHALAVGDLPPIHRDPFDRLLVAQAIVEGVMLLTSDATVARYPGPIRKV
jgi:PIN domain nuclease of toxin-antitoxin system